MKLKVLWTMAGSMGTVSDIEMLKKAKPFSVDVITADAKCEDAAGFVIVGKKFVVPEIKDARYINAILDICKQEKITTIIPQYTDELLLMSENTKLFDSLGIKVLVTEDTGKLKIANCKSELYQYFKHKDYIPKYTLASDIESVKIAAASLGYPSVPVCVKPAHGEGGKGFRIITGEKIDIFNEPSDSPKISLKAYLSQFSTMDNIPELLVTEYLPGKEYSVDCVCKNGTTYICIPRQRVETSMGVSTVSFIDKNEELISYTKEIVSSLNLSYNINIQFKYSDEGKPKLIEVNPRVSGSLVANYGAGINMLEAALKLAYDMPLGNINIKWGTKMIRHWSEIFIHQRPIS
ncbi:MAG: ATP-grasp domain-containing protein [Clostridiaceae bacterium]|nr:ATP-grasp domain-containing protein [Clostridiaceae bacterium]